MRIELRLGWAGKRAGKREADGAAHQQWPSGRDRSKSEWGRKKYTYVEAVHNNKVYSRLHTQQTFSAKCLNNQRESVFGGGERGSVKSSVRFIHLHYASHYYTNDTNGRCMTHDKNLLSISIYLPPPILFSLSLSFVAPRNQVKNTPSESRNRITRWLR